MKKCLSLLLAALMLAAVLTGCGGNPSTEETDAPADTGTEQAAQTNWNVSSVTGTGTELKFRTGGDQGTYYGFGSVLAQAITTNGNGTKVTAVVSNGSQDNIEQMQMNVAQLGFVQSDVMSYAYNGERLFEGFPYADFSTVAALYMEQVQIVTCDPDIKSVADLEGKTVSIGASGSGVYYNALDTPSTRTSAPAPTPCRTARSTPPSWWQAPPPWLSPLWPPPRTPIWWAWMTSTLPSSRSPLPTTRSTSSPRAPMRACRRPRP